MQKYYPINLAVKNKKCVVIGGGNIAKRKAKRLLECGASLVVISPKAAPALKDMARKREIALKNKKFNLKDLAGAYLVIAATDDKRVNSAVSSYCRGKNIPVNIVDSPDECSFILPSVIRRGNLTISVSTEGVSPLLSKKIRQDLEKRYGRKYSELLRMMEKIRPLALKKIKNQKLRKAFFLKILKAKNAYEIKCILKSIS